MGARITCLLCTFIISCGACLADSGHVVTLEDLSSIKAVDYKVEISPDGSQIAFYSTDSGTFQLWVMNVETLRKRQITNVEGGIAPQGRTLGYWIYDPLRYCWSPDGTK